MTKCKSCDWELDAKSARFCGQCGAEISKGESSDNKVDQPEKVALYTALMRESYFECGDLFEFDQIASRARTRLNVSLDTHKRLLSWLQDQAKLLANFSNFRFEFNENALEAYAGHDAFLEFRYTNLSKNEAFKASVLWRHEESEVNNALRAGTKEFVRPLSSASFGGSLVFTRMGTKEISELKITVSDQFGVSAHFRAEPFRVNVVGLERSVTNQYATHNEISISGRGVVDATRMGSTESSSAREKNNAPVWRTLAFKFIPSELSSVNDQAGGVKQDYKPPGGNESFGSVAVSAPRVSVYLPGKGGLEGPIEFGELEQLIKEIRSERKHWHFLVAAPRGKKRLAIRDLILKKSEFQSSFGIVLRTDTFREEWSEIMHRKQPKSLLEFDVPDPMLLEMQEFAVCVRSALTLNILEVKVGEGPASRWLSLPLEAFCSIFYCNDLSKVPTHLLADFHCCVLSEG